MPDFIGGDPDSNANECPAVFVDPQTGDFLVRGKTITDPAVITDLNKHIGRADDETDVWLPARMAPIIREALEGYEQGRQGPGQHTFAELLASTRTSVIRLEMRDSYDETESGFAEWQATGDTGAYDWGDHLDLVRAAVARGVRFRRVRIVSEPLSDYLRWEHACTDANIRAGEDIRWLPRTSAADLLLPGADCFVFDHRVVRWNFQRGDGTNPRHYTFSSDPRTIRDITAAFELAWDRATPHAEYKTD
ncbi:MAG TPA: hypothetical protein VMV92_16360 [Streptosporangiaceae bacterium]|nr:hypothetical protein [Streptosporangiaceae bacterium]